MKNKIKVGDKVRCIKETMSCIKVGEVYTVTGVFDTYIYVNCEVGVAHPLSRNEYEPVKKTFNNLEVGDVLVNPEYLDVKVIAICGGMVALETVLGGAWDWNKLEEIKKNGWKLKNSEPEEVELTMDEIAEKFNVDVKKLKIKKEK